MNDKANKSKIFDTVFSSLKETRIAFFANFISAFALLLTSLGLILASQKVKPIIDIDAIYYCSIGALLFFGAAYCNYLLGIKKKSARLTTQLDELDYMDNKYYKHYEISKSEFIPMILSTIVIFLVLILVLSWVKFIFVAQ